MAVVIGFQAVTFAIFTKVFAVSEGLLPEDARLSRILRRIRLEAGLAVGIVLLLCGLGSSVYALSDWGAHEFGALDPFRVMRMIIPAVTALVLGFGVIFLLPVVYEMMIAGGGSGRQWMPRLAHWMGTLPPGLTMTIDLSAYLVLFAAMVRVYRTAMAKFEDRAVRCRRCGHDLRGTPTDEGTGRGACGECGSGFVRS